MRICVKELYVWKMGVFTKTKELALFGGCESAKQIIERSFAPMGG